MLIAATPDVTLTAEGRVRLDLAPPLRDLLCDLAQFGASFTEALEDLSAALSAQGAGPDDAASQEMLDAAVHEALDALVAMLGADVLAATMTPDTAYHLAGWLMAESMGFQRKKLAVV